MQYMWFCKCVFTILFHTFVYFTRLKFRNVYKITCCQRHLKSIAQKHRQQEIITNNRFCNFRLVRRYFSRLRIGWTLLLLFLVTVACAFLCSRLNGSVTRHYVVSRSWLQNSVPCSVNSEELRVVTLYEIYNFMIYQGDILCKNNR